jgi:hypothetical protein
LIPQHAIRYLSTEKIPKIAILRAGMELAGYQPFDTIDVLWKARAGIFHS